MTTHDTAPATPHSPRRGPPRSDWCACPHGFDMPFYAPDDTCVCGEAKHHYHFSACKGIVQVG